MSKQRISIQVEKPGLLSLVQDLGRSGYQSYGLPVGGALDRQAAKTANWLVGREAGAPVLEITLQGPELRFSGDVQIAIAGADLTPMVDGEALPMYRTTLVKKGQVVSFGACRSGCRAYLAVGGHWQLPNWLNSFSALQIGDDYWPRESRWEKGMTIDIIPGDPIEDRSLSRKEKPFLSQQLSLHCFPGPEYSWFSETDIHFFSSQPFSVDPNSNRMGYRLRESLPDYRPQRELISSGIIPGTVQVLPSGIPIILLADAQTTGGYPRIANVAVRDLDHLAQMKPGDKIRFCFKNANNVQ